MSKSEHTPTPWKVSKAGSSVTVRTQYSEIPVAELWLNGYSAEANAELIVRAVNAHAALVEALDDLADRAAADGICIEKAEEILKLARKS